MRDKKHQFAVHFGCSPFKTRAAGVNMAFGFALPILLVAVLALGVVFQDRFTELTTGAFMIGNLRELTAKRQEMKTKSDALAAVFALCKTDDGTSLDMSKMDKFGDLDCTGMTSVAKADVINKANLELTDIGKEVEALQGVLDAQANVAKLNASRQPGIHAAPAGGDGGAAPGGVLPQSLGQMVAQSDQYVQHFANRKDKSGMTFNFKDIYPSELLVSKHAEGLRHFFNTLFETTAGWAPESIRLPGFVEAVTRPVQLLDIIPLSRTGMDTIKFMEETTRTHAAAAKAEGAAFAESTFAHTEQTSPVEKITDSVPVTDEQLEDVQQTESYLNGRVVFGLRQALDNLALNGNGTPPNIRGILNVAGIQTQAKGADPVPDTVYKGITKLLLTGRAMATHVVMHPNDWQSIKLLRTTDGIYIWGSPADAGPERIWGLPVVKGDVIAENTGLVGSFQSAWISLFERRGVDVQVGYTGTQFVEGKRTIRGDMRMALAVFRPAAFCSLTGI